MMKKALRSLLLACELCLAGVALADVTFYEREDFRGRSFTIAEPVANFGRIGFNDRASSVVVRSGSHLVCDDAGYRGRCVTLGPGNYRSLRAMGLNNRISSSRPVHARGRDTGSRAVLFEQPNFGGRRLVLRDNQTVRNLAGSSFNDRASSLRVGHGSWTFCSHADFQGVCHTFGPGAYPHLPRQLNNRISSGGPEYSPELEEHRQQAHEEEARRRRQESRRESRD
ncbi:MAG: hypothetical protein A2W68_10345 [Betaproteobacteria bacterium RIFCSPLOWO2_02_64_14]|nr:MAG: hypothetical protein A2W68_10345 [Betaproteobacteria bacterium RIFCSPLOWO2_02_64_14]